MRSLQPVRAATGRYLIVLAAIALAAAVSSEPHSARGQVGFRQLTSTHPVAVRRGTEAEVRLRSNFTLDDAYQVFFNRPGIEMSCLETEPKEAPRKGRGSDGTPFRFQVRVPADQVPGVYEYRVATRQAVSSVAQLLVTDFPVVEETPDRENGTPATAQTVELPAAVCGVCERFEDVDCYRFTASKGQWLTCEMFAQRVTDKIHSMVVRGPRIYLMDSILSLIGPNGQIVAQDDNTFGGDSLLRCRIPSDGEYTLEVRDARYAGDARYTYCLEISRRPYVRAVFPPAMERGRRAELQAVGQGLERVAPLSWEVPTEEPVGWALRQFPLDDEETGEAALSNPVWTRVSDHPEIVEAEEAMTVAEADAESSGPTTNNTVANAQPLSLPCGVSGRLAAPDDIDYFAFEAKKGEHFRLEIEASRYGWPADCILELWDADGKRLGEADDLTSLKTKDSRYLWTAPADGRYFVSVRDLHDRGGPEFVYHLLALPAGPDFELFGEYYYAMLAPGTRMVWFTKIERQFGFDGPVRIEVENLPEGVTATPVTIPGSMNHCAILLTAAEDAPINATLVRVVGRATVERAEGEPIELVRHGHITCEQQSSGGGQSRWPIETSLVGVTTPLDLLSVRATPEEVQLRPGESAEIQVELERAPGFNDAVTLAMSFDYFANKLGEQLPPGVTMSSKSKARVTKDKTSGTIVLEASDKAEPIERLPITVLARVSITFSITTNYGSNPVYVTVLPKDE